MAISTTITALPTPPSRSDAANFDTRADAFLSALEDLPAEINAFASEANALPLGSYFTATSTDSETIGTGSKTFTLAETNRAYGVGAVVKVSYDKDNYMQGTVTAYSSNDLTVNVDVTTGAGTYANWSIVLNGTLSNNAGLVHLATITASSSSTVDFENYFSSNYDNYIIEIVEAEITSDARIICRVKTTGWETASKYSDVTIYHDSNNATIYGENSANKSASFMRVTMYADTANSNPTISATIKITLPTAATPTTVRSEATTAFINVTTGQWDTSIFHAAGAFMESTVVTGIRFFPDAGVIATGTFRLYGVSNG